MDVTLDGSNKLALRLRRIACIAILVSIACWVVTSDYVRISGSRLRLNNGWATDISNADFDKEPDFTEPRHVTWRSFVGDGFVATWHEPGQTRLCCAVRLPHLNFLIATNFAG